LLLLGRELRFIITLTSTSLDSSGRRAHWGRDNSRRGERSIRTCACSIRKYIEGRRHRTRLS
jgi:hypothetical protein